MAGAILELGEGKKKMKSHEFSLMLQKDGNLNNTIICMFFFFFSQALVLIMTGRLITPYQVSLRVDLLIKYYKLETEYYRYMLHFIMYMYMFIKMQYIRSMAPMCVKRSLTL